MTEYVIRNTNLNGNFVYITIDDYMINSDITDISKATAFDTKTKAMDFIKELEDMKYSGWSVVEKENKMKYNYVLKSKTNKSEDGKPFYILGIFTNNNLLDYYKLTTDMSKAQVYTSEKEVNPKVFDGFEKVEIKPPVWEQIDKETLLDLLYYRNEGSCSRATNDVLAGYSPARSSSDIVDAVNELNCPF